MDRTFFKKTFSHYGEIFWTIGTTILLVSYVPDSSIVIWGLRESSLSMTKNSLKILTWQQPWKQVIFCKNLNFGIVQSVVMPLYIKQKLFLGCLIDTISTKGENGFIAFMEVIEYSYPDLFRTLTNLIPRRPPECMYLFCGFILLNHSKTLYKICNHFALSKNLNISLAYQATARVSITDHLLECLSSLQESLQEKRENLEHMQTTIHTMKV